MKYQTIVFDFDGTLADTFNIYLAEIIHTIPELKNFALTPENLRKFKAMGLDQILHELKIPKIKFYWYYLRNAKKIQLKAVNAPIFEGIRDAVLRLQMLGCELVVVTSNQRFVVQEFLRNHKLEVFTRIVGEFNIFAKHRALKKLKLKDALYIGDEIRDVLACKKAGVPMCAVTWGYNSTAAFVNEYKPEHLVRTPDELYKLIESENLPKKTGDQVDIFSDLHSVGDK